MLLSLSLLTACKTTDYIVPVIIEPEVLEAPTHEPWTFSPIDENNQNISNDDLRILAKYIVDLKSYSETGWDWVQYYIDELNNIKEQFK